MAVCLVHGVSNQSHDCQSAAISLGVVMCRNRMTDTIIMHIEYTTYGETEEEKKARQNDFPKACLFPCKERKGREEKGMSIFLGKPEKIMPFLKIRKNARQREKI